MAVIKQNLIIIIIIIIFTKAHWFYLTNNTVMPSSEPIYAVPLKYFHFPKPKTCPQNWLWRV